MLNDSSTLVNGNKIVNKIDTEIKAAASIDEAMKISRLNKLNNF